ncbi:MAG: hypothetical protein O7B99_02440, partial [Planctomycetota bacterium]|nr:hypothetical protein [Planctomycetota bacterium]
MTTLPALKSWLERRLAPAGLDWFQRTAEEIAGGPGDDRFATLISMASRHARRDPLAPDEDELATAGRALEGWNPERWNLL